MGAAGYRIVVERFSMDAHVRRVEALYDEELQRAGALAALRGRAAGGDGDGRSPARPRGRAAMEVPPV
jgi:hypothetical protein